jgi:ribosomal protein L11 methyltransferase
MAPRKSRQPTFVRLTVKVAPEALPGVAEVLLSLTRGVEERATDSEVALIAYLSTDGDAERAIEQVKDRLRALRAAGIKVGRGGVTRRRIRSKAWEEAWKAGFDVVRIGRQLTIKPTWKQYVPAPGEVVVELDPGMAFGTGQHATTRACLNALAALLRRGDIVFDIGTGSGILAIAAAKLGASHVLAIDADESAARIARQNTQINHEEDVVGVVCGHGLEAVRGQAEIIVANLTSPQIVALAPAVAGHLRPGGIFIASGIAADADQPQMVRNAVEAAGMELREIIVEDDWVAIAWNRRGEGPHAPSLILGEGDEAD